MKPLLPMLLFSALLIGGCLTDSDDSATAEKPSIVGIWQSQTVSSVFYVFRVDGTYGSQMQSGTYAIDGKQLILSYPESSSLPDTFSYLLSNEVLTLIQATANNRTYRNDYIRVAK